MLPRCSIRSPLCPPPPPPLPAIPTRAQAPHPCCGRSASATLSLSLPSWGSLSRIPKHRPTPAFPTHPRKQPSEIIWTKSNLTPMEGVLPRSPCWQGTVVDLSLSPVRDSKVVCRCCSFVNCYYTSAATVLARLSSGFVFGVCMRRIRRNAITGLKGMHVSIYQ